jgi:hypothetical protein
MSERGTWLATLRSHHAINPCHRFRALYSACPSGCPGSRGELPSGKLVLCRRASGWSSRRTTCSSSSGCRRARWFAAFAAAFAACANDGGREQCSTCSCSSSSRCACSSTRPSDSARGSHDGSRNADDAAKGVGPEPALSRRNDWPARRRKQRRHGRSWWCTSVPPEPGAGTRRQSRSLRWPRLRRTDSQ